MPNNNSLERRLEALEKLEAANDQARQLHTLATAANDQPLHWSERGEWKEVLSLFRLGSSYNELPARFDATGRCALPTPTYPAHWPDHMKRHERGQALVDNINRFRDTGGVLVLLTLPELATARDWSARLLLPMAEAISAIGHAQWGSYIQSRYVVEKAIAAWQAQTGEQLDTPIALVEWLDATWRAWSDEGEADEWQR